jgi:ankyrin repeat protein
MRLTLPCQWLPVAVFAFATIGAAEQDLRLVRAVKHRDTRDVRVLLQQRVDVNTPEPDGSTPLHWAAYWDDGDTADLLLRAKAQANAKNELGATPLWLACMNGSASMVARLLKAGADPNSSLPTGETPVMTVSRTGNLEAVSALLTAGANVNARESVRGQTALMWAVGQQHPDVVNLLIGRGADIRARSNVTRRVVRLAGAATYAGAAVAEQDLGGFTPLLFAARAGDLESARLLVASGADVNDSAPAGTSALIVAVHSGHPAVAAFLLDKGADANAGAAGYTALHAAVLRGDVESVRSLLAHGANPNAKLLKATGVRRRSIDWSMNQVWLGATPFWLAAKFSEIGIMRLLTAGGADPLVLNNAGTTALAAAAAGTIDRLGDSPADGYYRPAPDPLLEDRDIQEAMTILLDAGVDVNAVNAVGDTALHAAAGRRLEAIVRFLLERGAKADARNKKGQTPLALAMQPIARNDDGGQASEMTERRNPEKTAAMLRDFRGEGLK